jgi:hypothetical protein
MHKEPSMKATIACAFIPAVLILGAPAVMHAHFKLLAPASWLVEDERGDPQKSGPCGGTNADYGKPSYNVTQAIGGATLHVKVQETIYHPGHYRVALAVNSPAELPVDPKATTIDSDRGPRSVSGEIQSPAQVPVLADGLFVHTAKTDAPFETDVTLPNISCRRCTLQVIQFMEQHAVNNPGMFTYHHCATLQITADPKKPIDAAWPKERS